MPAPRIATAQQAKLLLDPQMLSPIHILMESPCSAAQLTERLGLSLRRTCTLLGKLESAGIAEVTERRPRRGRAIKVYEVAPLWHIPYEFTTASTLEDLMWQNAEHYQRRLNDLLVVQMRQHAPCWDFWLSPGRIFPAPANGESDLFGSPEPVHHMIGGLLLTDAEAREFKRRLLALQYEYEALSKKRPGVRNYALSLTLTAGQWWGDESA